MPHKPKLCRQAKYWHILDMMEEINGKEKVTNMVVGKSLIKGCQNNIFRESQGQPLIWTY